MESTDGLTDETITDGTASNLERSTTYATDDQQNHSSFPAPENLSSKGNDATDENSLNTTSKERDEEQLASRKGIINCFSLETG